MKLMRFVITPASPWSGRLRSDTLSGLVLWLAAEREGGAFCQELIQKFRDGEPPFILSSPLPQDTLPFPCLKPIPRERFRELFPERPKEGQEISLFEALQKFKAFRKSPGLPVQAWIEAKGALSSASLFLWHLRHPRDSVGATFSRQDYVPHVAIDRQTGAARDGELFFTRVTYFNPSSRFHLYARAENPAWLLEYLKLMGRLGCGANSGTGCGQFTIEPDSSFSPETLELEGGGASILLSVCASPDMAAISGYYKLSLKLGKTGPGHANPFKRPFLMLQEGSVLSRLPKPPYTLDKINVDERIVQILQPLALPCRLESTEPL